MAYRGTVRGNVVTLEEGVIEGGFGSAVREMLDRNLVYHPAFKSFGLPADIYPVGRPEEIRKVLGLDADGLAAAIRDFYKKQKLL